VDVFAFLPRPQLAKLVPQVGNWHFASKAQYFLHECGRFTIGRLRIKKPYGHGPVIVKEGQQFPLADVPRPENIIDFKKIYITRFIWL
jgi:hypothetical protein